MTLIRKVKRNVLQTFKELYRKGKSLNIHKTTFLCQTYEKNCWRKTRLREEKVYYKKYNFLKHAYDVVNYGIDNNLKFEIEEKNIVEEDSYIHEEKKKQSEKNIKSDLTNVDLDIKKILKSLEDMNRKYNQNYKNFTHLYYNVMNKNVPLKKNEFIKKYNNVYNPTDLTILYYYIKKFKLLTKKKKQLSSKLHILKLRRNVFDKVNFSFPVDKLEEMFYEHSKKINVL
ncbi:conserved Plasmodium protein, unknown function [Plasmodium ovale wallikeri]|uniref:Uncharacterized protein n=2 Tax=Plasmodium ovale TaxID=36330 RepID=A0A1A8ZH14_PLAOA|nr:conserved Plasmodium protein, unknown function [Plasmodium ovale wallikeri]SBT43324.1 conserved Plasmodium protein, unknown function [Plasmodium ovale wallikeri]SBT78407.1 conserved Plasmodium protein, unknown function [Plasmodium ovale]